MVGNYKRICARARCVEGWERLWLGEVVVGRGNENSKLLFVNINVSIAFLFFPLFSSM